MLDFGSVLLQHLDGTGSKYTLSTGKHKIGTYIVDHRVVLHGSQDNARDKRTMEVDDVHCTSTFFGSPCRCSCLLIPGKKDQIFFRDFVLFSVAAKTMLGINEQWRGMMYIVQVHSWIVKHQPTS